MRSFLIFFVLVVFFYSGTAKAAAPLNDELQNATIITNISAFCSSDAAYNNLEATPSSITKPREWPSIGKDVWFKFTATKYDVNISVSGLVNASSTNTIISPLVALYSFETTNNTLGEMVGTSFTSNNVTSLYKGALVIGQVYLIRVSAANDATGTFKLCVDNYFPPIRAGQDCSTASILCSKETFTQSNVTGTGLNNRESAGTCLGTESNSAWYKFTASKSGDFTFTITPTVTTNDIDWIFYDLGVNGDCNMVNATNAIRCAAGSGVTCSPSYYKTGLSMTESDLTEASGCPSGQNGFVKYVDLIEGHTYALLIDNFSSGNNGFTLEFGGSAEFAGPSAEILVEKLNPCTDAQAYRFKSEAKNYADLKWSFGENASLTSATTEGPFTVTYSSPGEKVIVLEATASNGCKVITTQTFMVGNTPAKPDISASGSNLCQGDVFLLSTPPVAYATYHWTGPNGFISNERNTSIPVTGSENVGIYSLFVQVGTCVSEINTFEVLSVDLKPKALFTILVNNKCENNQSFSFENASANYSKISWDFGPTVASRSNLANDGQLISFNNPGLKTIILTVESKNGCTSTMTQNLLVEVKADQPTIQINQPLFCLKDVIKMSVPELAGVTYAWTGPNNFNATTSSVEIPILSQTQAGVYTVILTSGSCVTDPATITIPPIAKIPVANFKTDPAFNMKFAVPAPISFINSSMNADFFEWDFGDGQTSTDINPKHIYNQNGLFKIKLTAFSNNGCFNTVTVGDLLIKDNGTVFTLNAFSPNGDGVNDELVVGITNLKKYHISIYNRYGTELFASDDIYQNWKGTYKNIDVPVGVYYYVIKGINLGNEPIKYSGSVTLIR